MGGKICHESPNKKIQGRKQNKILLGGKQEMTYNRGVKHY